MFIYQRLIDLLPNEEVNTAITKIVDNYDMTGNYHEKNDSAFLIFNAEELLKKYLDLPNEFLSLIEDYANKEYEKLLSGSLEYYPFFENKEDVIRQQKESIYESLVNYLESKAKVILDNREYLRIPIGKTVDFNNCMLHYPFLGKVEFYKDGGWGIAEDDGTIIVRNHLKVQPSKTPSLYCDFSHSKTFYWIIQDRDTKKYGILSYESFYESIHCLYEEIRVIDFYEGQRNRFYIAAKKNGKWGCFDESCALIIDFEYDLIRLANGFLECIREAEYLLDDSLYDRDNNYVIKGRRYLYNEEGILLIGGYNYLFDNYNCKEFYFGTSYEHYDVEETDFYGNPCIVSKVRLNYQKSKCLVLDDDFKTIFSNGKGVFRMPKGHTFNSIEQLEKLIPSDYLLRYNVDLIDLNSGFIYLSNYYGEQYFVPFYIRDGFSTLDEWYESRSQELREYNERKEQLQYLLGGAKSEPSINMPFDSIESASIRCSTLDDLYIDDSVISIIMLNERKEVAWIGYVSEIEKAEFFTHIYRKGNKFGFFDENGIKPAIYDAITRETPDHKIYVASFEYCGEPNQMRQNKQYYCNWKHMYIHYYVLNEDGTYITVESNKELFNPRKCKWFPYDFVVDNYGEDFEDSFVSDVDRRYDWTDEDAWDAMTDGMSGGYPGPGWDPETFGF